MAQPKVESSCNTKMNKVIPLKQPAKHTLDANDDEKDQQSQLCLKLKASTDKEKNMYNPICWRFPQLRMCGCTRPCRMAVDAVKIYEIIPGLFVGAVHGAYKHSTLKSKNVTRILNVSNEKYFERKDMFQYLQIDVEDAVTSNIEQYFMKSNQFIDEALSAKNAVYVHCRAGISRSPSFIMAYLMWKQSIGYKQADHIMGKVHPDANPNSSFVRQLQHFEGTLNEQRAMDEYWKSQQLDD